MWGGGHSVSNEVCVCLKSYARRVDFIIRRRVRRDVGNTATWLQRQTKQSRNLAEDITILEFLMKVKSTSRSRNDVIINGTLMKYEWEMFS